MWFLPESSNVGMLEYQGAGLTFLENALTRETTNDGTTGRKAFRR